MGERSGTLTVRAVLDAVPLPVLLLDRGLVVAHVNAGARQLLTDVVAPGRCLRDLVAADERVDGRRVLRLRPQAAVQGTVRLVLRDAGPASLAVVELDAAPVRPAGPAAVPTARPPARVVPLPAAPAPVPTAVGRWTPVVRLTDGHPVALESAPAAGARDRLQEACHAAAGWHRRWPGAGPQVLVGLPARELLRPGVGATVREALQVAACPPGALLLDVTEAVLAWDDDVTPAALHGLVDLGVGLAVDHLGTGSPSLRYLSRLPVGVLRLAPSLVAGVEHDRQARALVASLAGAARRAGAVCLADGVDAPGLLAALQSLGCELGQGAVVGPPLALEAVPGWLEQALRPPAPAGAAATADAPTVARALELQGQGASLHTIAARLNLEGHRNVLGRRWHHTTVAQLLADCAAAARRPHA